MEGSSEIRLQQICVSKSDCDAVIAPFRVDASTRVDEKLQIESGLCRYYPREAWAKELHKGASPHPLLLHPQHYHNLEIFHEALVLAVTSIVERWWSDPLANFPERMPLELQEENLLRWMEQEASSAVRPLRQCAGSWRPDFLIEERLQSVSENHVLVEQFVVCEINARFAFNGFCISRASQKVMSEMGADEKGLMSALKSGEVLDGLLGLFDLSRPLHLLKGEEYGIDIHLFVEDVERQTGLRPIFITPGDLRLVPSEDARFGYKLCCIVKEEGRPLSNGSQESSPTRPRRPARLIHNGEVLEEIHQVGLELHQRELRALSPELLRQIALRCFNDMRSLFLVHDKRMLGIILQELGDLVRRGVLREEQAEILRNGIAESLIPGSKELEEFLDRCKKQSEAKIDYLLKPIRSGKGAGILFGDEVSAEEWISKLESLQDPQLAADQTSYVVQRQVRQPTYPVMLREEDGLQYNKLIGTYISIHGKFMGLGIWRSGPGRICAVSHGGAFFCSVMSSRHCSKQPKEDRGLLRYVEWLHSLGSWLKRRFVNRKSVD